MENLLVVILAGIVFVGSCITAIMLNSKDVTKDKGDL